MIQYLSKTEIPEIQGFKNVTRRDTVFGTLYSLSPENDEQSKYSQDGWIPISPEIKIRNVGEFKIDSLKRESTIGDKITIGEYNLIVPKLRCCPSGTQLPQKMTLVDGGMAYRVLDRHLKAWNHGDKIWDFFVDGKELTNEDILAIYEDVLSINYFINRNIILVAGMIDSQSVITMLKHLVDMETWDKYISESEAEKKSEKVD